ncbi:sporulation integral membrane protein YtvI [Evansella caseinilytica]|uniref:Sporulation integral membrane protein YtvI n=1 Tax=Evansella caseinilytica TaxID=1503961 RepID=A0A1H3GUH2_9BACI|nr:sporulation integral membrane protein YtvI [Evansella caseinilytica]SDY06767.1 sporulation integral membrane protein YtvI [Evansella caseinilytica]
MTKTQAWAIVRFFSVVILLILAFWLFGWLFKATYPFWIATFLVWMFLPLIRLLRRRLRFPNGFAVLFTLLIGISTLIAAFVGLIYLIAFGIRRVSHYVPLWIETASVQVQQFFNDSVLPLWRHYSGFVDSLTPEQQSTLQEGITQLGSHLASMFADMGQALADALTHMIMLVPPIFIGFLFVFLAFYFIGKDWDQLLLKTKEKIPASLLKKMLEIRKMFQYRVFGFLRAQVIMMAIASMIVLIGLLILRIDQAFTIAAIVGIAEILPYFGSGTILIPWILYSFITGNISLGIGLAIVYGVTVLIRQSIEPKVLSSSMNLNTLSVLFSLFVGWQLFGIIGVFLGPFILVIFVIFTDVGITSEVTQFIRHGWKKEEEG